MKISDMPTLAEFLEEDCRRDPSLRELWERHALAREVSHRILRFRAEHDLSQTALARILGMKQPAICRLEIGETNPSIETLQRLSEGLGIEFLIDISPTKRRRLVTAESTKRAVTRATTHGGRASVLIAMT
jgi:ribosome-binding protein aMBF1 (putative translation factor)